MNDADGVAMFADTPVLELNAGVIDPGCLIVGEAEEYPTDDHEDPTGDDQYNSYIAFTCHDPPQQHCMEATASQW